MDCRGRLYTDDDGNYAFRCVKPGKLFSDPQLTSSGLPYPQRRTGRQAPALDEAPRV